MRCALCGGEIDSKTKQCLKCGECWGGGNRGIAQDISRVDDAPVEEFEQPSLAEVCLQYVKGLLTPVDKALVGCAGKAAALFNKKTTAHQNRLLAYGSVLVILALIIIIPTVCCAACTSQEICGRWVSADSGGSVSIEFSEHGDITMYVLSNGEEKVYRSGTYSTDGELLEIHYDDGEVITLTYSIDKDTAVFTLLSTGQSQTYIRK